MAAACPVHPRAACGCDVRQRCAMRRRQSARALGGVGRVLGGSSGAVLCGSYGMKLFGVDNGRLTCLRCCLQPPLRPVSTCRWTARATERAQARASRWAAAATDVIPPTVHHLHDIQNRSTRHTLTAAPWTRKIVPPDLHRLVILVHPPQYCYRAHFFVASSVLLAFPPSD